jgi:DNA polymerase-3 subunit beta
MELFIDRDALGRGLSRVQGIIERRSTQPILSHALLHAKGQSLRLTATDTEIAFLGELEANVLSPGEIAVDAASLFQVVRALPEPTVRLRRVEGTRLEITSGRASFALVGVGAEEYPPLPPFTALASAEVSESALRRVIEQVSTAVPSDDLRWGLNGAHLEERQVGAERRVRFVSTDGHRLACSEAPFTGELGTTTRQLVPRKALAVLKRLLEGDGGALHLDFGQGAIQLRRTGESFWFRLIDGEFPDYKAVVPREHRHTVTLRRSDLLATLRRVAILAADRTRPVKFSVRDGEIEVQVSQVDRGEVNETVPAELDGAEFVVGFNPKYLQEALGVMGGDRVVLEMPSPQAACVVRDPDVDDSFYIVMPMRLD